ncbi:MAG: hypothetical protein GC153_02750 [Alphaproteobacteria bacterium]|nr:hypothetical protein [Alphaproteobacteria bacterium]
MTEKIDWAAFRRTVFRGTALLILVAIIALELLLLLAKNIDLRADPERTGMFLFIPFMAATVGFCGSWGVAVRVGVTSALQRVCLILLGAIVGALIFFSGFFAAAILASAIAGTSLDPFDIAENYRALACFSLFASLILVLWSFSIGLIISSQFGGGWLAR